MRLKLLWNTILRIKIKWEVVGEEALDGAVERDAVVRGSLADFLVGVRVSTLEEFLVVDQWMVVESILLADKLQFNQLQLNKLQYSRFHH